MQDISGEAMAAGDEEKLAWCNRYISELRKIELRKYDEVTCHIFEYMETYSKRTPEEIAALKKTERSSRSQKTDLSKRDFVELTEKRADLLFGIWANVQSKNMFLEGVSFSNSSGQLLCKSMLP